MDPVLNAAIEKSRGVELMSADRQECRHIMGTSIREERELWQEDIGE